MLARVMRLARGMRLARVMRLGRVFEVEKAATKQCWNCDVM